jgi:hypothetical protein
MNQRYFERVSAITVLVCLSLLCAVGARAQETGDILGTVTDTSGGIVPGATVTLTNTATNISQTTQTAGDGNYAFTLLQVGSYSVKVEAKGFKTYSAPSIALSSGDRARVDAKMEVGEQSTTVEVQATTAPALQTDTSSVGSLVPSQSVEDLPLNGRNVIQLVERTVGVTEGSPGSIVEGNRPDDRRQVTAFSVNGQADTQNNNLIDGMDNNERIIGTIGVRPSIDAIQEVNIQTNKYDASVGRTAGAVVDLITKSGSNSFHGSAYEFFRNKVLNANPNWNFSEALAPSSNSAPAPNPAFRQNQYGGSLGGPIKKDKTFFFADYEGYAYGTGLKAALYSVPTLCERGLTACPDGKTQFGDFSDLDLVSKPGGSSTQSTTPGPNLSSLPLCASSYTPWTCMAPLGVGRFNMYPLPNTGAAGAIVNNYTSAPVQTQVSDTWDTRIDQHFSDKNTLYGRLTHNGETTVIPNGFPNVTINPATGAAEAAGTSGGVAVIPVVLQYSGRNNETQEQFTAGFVHVFNPNLLLNLKLGVLRSNINSEPANEGTFVSTALGFPCNATACVNDPTVGSPVQSGLLSATISGANSSGALTTIGDSGSIPIHEYDTSFQYLAGLTWNRGPHSLRFGLSLIRRQASIGQGTTDGSMSFTGAYTGVAPGDLLEGLSTSYSSTVFLVQQHFFTWEPSGYVQDDWRARPWLTLNLGVRYDIFTPYTEGHGRISNYDPYLGLIVSPAIPGIQQSNATDQVPTRYGDLAPRLGFAATLPHNTVIRGGVGLTYFPVNYESPYYEKNAPFKFSGACQAQNEIGTNVSCATAQFGTGTVGQFNNGLTVEYGLPTTTSSSNVGQTGGDLMSAGVPTPFFNIALATNPANYAGTSISAIQTTNFKEVYLEQFNLGLQKEIGANVINIGYVGEIGRHVQRFDSSENQNLATNPSENITGLPLTVGGTSDAGFGTLQGYPYLKTVSVSLPEQGGTSFYNGLQASFVRRFSRGLTGNFNYVWSHILDNNNGNAACVVSDFATPEPCFYDLSNGAGPSLAAATSPTACSAEPTQCRSVLGWQVADWGTDTQNVADRFTWALDYQLPFGKSMTGIEGGIVKGWSTNISGSWQTGIPFSVTAATSNSNIAGSQELDQTCSGRLAHPTILEWYNYNCFVQPVAGTEGDERPGQFDGPPQKRLDASLFKEFPIKENLRLQFRTEIFNLFNSVNFNTPAGTTIAYNSNGTVNLSGSHSTTAQITAVNAAWNQREIQFALKLIF